MRYCRVDKTSQVRLWNRSISPSFDVDVVAISSKESHGRPMESHNSLRNTRARSYDSGTPNETDKSRWIGYCEVRTITVLQRSRVKRRDERILRHCFIGTKGCGQCSMSVKNALQVEWTVLNKLKICWCSRTSLEPKVVLGSFQSRGLRRPTDLFGNSLEDS